ncbi:HAD-IA family hydrolase [Pseudoduganella sp. FT55W]|uniref:HAD-IA family hydrolase n=1 Tax=Duganella rivi TaxID=2666083 RepID=A0A7X4GTI5_9BURK|nr:HAD-IA family hydrolase [Duganella rivi]MYM69417.1 HAD-IA family hydrolase [Duganella rivi]
MVSFIVRSDVNITRSKPVWLFDLDNTLHNASHAIFPAIMAGMNSYLARLLGDGVTPASDDVVNATRTMYWQRYGATTLGVVKHHGVKAEHFLDATHRFDNLESMIRAERGLRQLLRRLPGRKILLTNAPHRYSSQVLRHLGLQRQFQHHVAVEAMTVHRHMRPKPSKLMLHKLMRHHRLTPGRCILVEDTLANLRSAREIGMRTAWVTQYLTIGDTAGLAHPQKRLIRPAYVDVKVKSVRNLPARMHRLR